MISLGQHVATGPASTEGPSQPAGRRPGFLAEALRRHLPRAALGYVLAACVLVRGLEAALNVFELSTGVVRILRILLVLGFPVSLVVAWFVDGPPRPGAAGPGIARRRPTWLVVAILGAMLAALTTGYQLYSRARSGPGRSRAQKVLVADFENRTGDAVFDGTLESAFTLALGNGSFFSSYSRPTALEMAEQLNLPGAALSEHRARLFARREGIAIVMAGLIEKADEGYTVMLRVIDAATGKVVFKSTKPARNKQMILAAVGKAAAEVHDALDDALALQPAPHP